jgi:amidase
MKSGEFSAEEIVEKYLERIRAIDPKLKSIIEINPDAERIAEELDKERKAGKLRGALHGIPVLLKDNIDTADRMKTTAGSLALLDAPTPKKDAFLAEQLRKSGAIILGKTNLSEWANFRSTKSSSGWSGRGGQTKNPYVLDRNACGSSTGSAVAIAANLAAIGVGTETDGSIVCPSSVCGIVGLKPTLGVVSERRDPIAHTQDTAGPMTRTVETRRFFGVWRASNNDSIRAIKKISPNIQLFCKDGLQTNANRRGERLLGQERDVDKVLNDALDAMKNAARL